MAENREKRLALNTFVLALGTFFPKLAVFITLPVITDRFTKAEYGTYDIILTLVSLLLPVATLQIQSSAFRFLIEDRENECKRKGIVSNMFAFIIPVSLICLTILFFSLFKYDYSLRVAIVIYFFFDTLTNATRQLARGFGKNNYYSFSALISASGQVAFIFLFVLGFHAGLVGAITALAIAEALSFFFMFLSLRIYKYFKISFVDLKQLKEMLSYSWPLVPNNLSSWALRASDRFVILAVLGVEINSIYAAAYKIPSILTFANTTFNMAWQESATMAVKSDDASRFYSNIFDKVYRITVGMLSMLIAGTPILFPILIKGDYEDAYPQIYIIYFGILFSVLSAFWGGIYVAYKKSKSVGLTTLLAAAINLIVDISLMKFIGLYAASISTVVSYICLCVFRMIDSRKLIHIRYNYKLMGITLLVLIIQCILGLQRILKFDAVNFAVGMTFCVIANRCIIKQILDKSKALLTDRIRN